MREHVVRYTDQFIGGPDEVFESPPYPADRAKDMAECYEMMGCKVVEIAPYLKKDLTT